MRKIPHGRVNWLEIAYCSAGWRRVVRFVQDEKRAGAKFAEDIAHTGGVGFVRSRLWARETASRSSMVDGEAALSAQLAHAHAVDESKESPNLLQARPSIEASLKGGAEITINRSAVARTVRARRARLRGLAEPHVVGDQEIDPRQPQRLAQREKLIGIEADAGPKRRLQQIPVCRRRRAPTDRAQVGGENLGLSGAPRPTGAQCRPR